MRLLIVEDEKRLAETLRRGLTNEGFIVDVTHDGVSGPWAATEHPNDAMLLDLVLPKKNGYDVLKNRSRDAETSKILRAAGRAELRFWSHEDPAEVARRVHLAVCAGIERLAHDRPEGSSVSGNVRAEGGRVDYRRSRSMQNEVGDEQKEPLGWFYPIQTRDAVARTRDG